MDSNIGKYLTELNQRLKKGTSVHLTKDGRLFYLNHENRTSSWLPPLESWDGGDPSLPYGWEIAEDSEGKTYYINHVNRTTTYEDPRKDDDDPPPQPREVFLTRDPINGFGFVVGSEKPVIVRFVKEGCASENKLLAGDQILRVNGEDVMKASSNKVVELVKSCKHSITLTVCQPYTNNSTRKSALLTAAKKAKLKSHPSRVRFAEGVAINGSPLYSPSPFESYVPFMPNVLKVFMENGQTKTFKYDCSTNVQDVLDSLIEKLSISCPEYYSLCTENIKSIRRDKLTLLDSKNVLSKIAARPGAHNLRCLFRITFVPKDVTELLNKDPVSLEYLYKQCCNDVIQERLFPELKYEVSLRLAAFHILEHAVSNGMVSNNGKVNLKAIEKEFGLGMFLPYSLFQKMKRKELNKALNSFLKQNQQLCPPGQKYLNVLQTKVNYLKIVSELPSYGCKIFSTSIKDSSLESSVMISPKLGICHTTKSMLRQSEPVTLARIEDVMSVKVTKDDELCYTVEIQLRNNNCFENSPLHLILDEDDIEEFILALKGYHRLLVAIDEDYKPFPVFWEVGESWWTDPAPSYYGRHLVKPAPWSYPPSLSVNETRLVDLSMSIPPYMPCDIISSMYSFYNGNNGNLSIVDHNMNNTEDGCIDYPSIVSLKVLDSPKDEDKAEDLLKQVETKIVSDTDIFLGNDDNGLIIEETNEPKLKAADSLLLLTAIDSTHDNSIDPVLIDGGSPHESDTDAESYMTSLSSKLSLQSNEMCLKGESPFRTRIAGLNTSKVTIPPKSKTSRSDSSFGLHSPDVIPSLSETESDLIETLKQFKNTGEYELPFAQTTIYFDPDIIDLTVIPPPNTLDISAISNLSMEESPTLYRGNLMKEDVTLKRLEDFDTNLRMLIIPPPPSSESSNQKQDEVIEAFWRATEEIKRLCNDVKGTEQKINTNSSDNSWYDVMKNEVEEDKTIRSLSIVDDNTIDFEISEILNLVMSSKNSNNEK